MCVVTETSAVAVVIGDDLDARRQGPVAVHLVDFGLDARQHVVGVLRPVHDHDRGDDVVVVVAAGDAEPRHVADIDAGHILHLNRDAVHLGQDDVLDVVDLVSLSEIVGAAVVDQSDAADVHRLLADD